MTLATMLLGSPVVIALMITEAYSPLRSISKPSPASRPRLVASYSSRLWATRERYSPIGTWKGSTWPLGMNHGLYSAWCSDDSVGVPAEPAVEVGPHEVILGHAAGRDEVLEIRIEVPAAVLQAQDPREVVHAAGQRVHLGDRHAQVSGEAVDRPVDGVAEADGRHAERLVDGRTSMPIGFV